MAKKQRTNITPDTPVVEQKSQSLPVVHDQEPFNFGDIRSWFTHFKGQAIIVALLAFALYCNTFKHEFAHDDGIVIVKNEYVLEGFAGIKGILTKDAYDSYYRQLNTTNQLKGGRFRPLSIVTFAIEQQFLGAVKEENVDSVLKQQISYGVSGPGQKQLVYNMNVRHVFNTLWYMLSVVVLLWFLRYIIFKKDPVVALIATILFAAHPIHTEVVANVKSRDEIMSLLFMCLTFIYAFKYEENKTNKWHLAAAMTSFFMAFLSKEYAISMMILLPLAFYIFRGYSFFKSITTTLPYIIIVTLYLAVRLNAVAPPPVEGDAGGGVRTLFPLLGIAAATFAVFKFLKPTNTPKDDMATFFSKLMPFVPYFVISGIYLMVRFSELPEVIESAAQEVLNNPYLYAEGSQKLATEIASTLYYLKFLLFPHPLSADYSYAQIPYKDFAHPMVWASIIIHAGIIYAMFRFFPKRKMNSGVESTDYAANGAQMICFAIAFYMVHLLMVNNLVFDIGATLGERLIYHSSVGFVMVVAWLLYKGFEKVQPAKSAQIGLASVVIVVTALMSFKTIDRNAAWKNDSTLFGTDIKTVPNSVLVNANVAASYITLADYAKDSTERTKYLTDAVKILDHTLSIHTKFVAAYLNRGIAWYKLGNIDETKANIEKVRALYPTYPTLPGMYKLICDYYLKVGWENYGKIGRYQEAIEEYKKGLQVDSNNIDLWYNMGGAYYTNRQPNEALVAFQRALRLQPNNQQAQAGINACMQMLNGPATPVQPGKK